MNIINSVCSTNNYLFGGDLYGIVYLWNLKSIYVEHLTRKVET